MEQYAPIVVTVYNRLHTFKRCIKSLQTNKLAKYSDLYVISDAPYCENHRFFVNSVREYARTITGFKKVHLIFYDINLGSQEAGYRGLSLALQDHDSYIFLEDDVIVSCNFLEYMNEGLHYYSNDPHVYSICGFCIPFKIPSTYKNDIWFSQINSPWGYATWKKKMGKS